MSNGISPLQASVRPVGARKLQLKRSMSATPMALKVLFAVMDFAVLDDMS
jgi:hypothetical protein